MGVLLFLLSLLSWIIAMCMLCYMMKSFSCCKFLVITFMLNFSILMLRLVLFVGCMLSGLVEGVWSYCVVMMVLEWCS